MPKKTVEKLLIESRFSVAEVCDIISRFGGLLLPAARHIDVSRGCLQAYCDRHPETKEAIAQGIETYADQAESVLLRTIDGTLQGATARDRADAAKFFLMNCAKTRRRGYAQKVELTGNDGAPLVPLNINIAPSVYDESNDGKRE